MEFKGTKGEWSIRSAGGTRKTIKSKDKDICDVWYNLGDGFVDTDEGISNAKLIAAAPELLEALQLLVDDGFQIPSNKNMDKAKKAIEKALK